MGFWDSVGEGMFGTQTKKQGQELAKQGAAGAAAAGTQAGQAAQYAGGQARAYDASARQSMGKNAADYMQKAQAAASQGAEQAGTAAATAGTQAALRASRSQGLSKGQAALAAGQQAGDIYSGTYQQGLQSGQDRYMQGAGQFAQQGQAMGNRQLGAMGQQLGAAQTQAGIGQSQQDQAAKQSAQTWGTIGTTAGVVGGMLSDERTKENVFDYGKAKESLGKLDVMKISKIIRPVKFEYKKEYAQAPGEHVGVMAQDLEKTPLAGAVKTGEDGLKRIDTAELTPGILNLVMQLAQEVSALKGGK